MANDITPEEARELYRLQQMIADACREACKGTIMRNDDESKRKIQEAIAAAFGIPVDRMFK